MLVRSFPCVLVDLCGLGGYVKLEVTDIAVLDFVSLALLLIQSVVLDFCFASQLDQVIILHDLGADETALHVRVDRSCSLRCFPAFAHRPALNLVFTCGEEMNQLECAIAHIDYLVDHSGRAKFFCCLVSRFFFRRACIREHLLFKGRRVWKHRTTAVLLDPCLNLRQVLVLLAKVVFVTNIH